MDISLLSAADAVFVAADGRIDVERRWNAERPTALLPGAFNPAHEGHWGLAEVAAEMLGLPVAFELSIANVDKTPLTPADVERCRLQFAGRASLWLTRAPQFVHKADLFPGAVFVVGADTAVRIVDRRYFEGDAARMEEALGRVREQGCRFLVACRIDSTGRCMTLADISLPSDFHDLFAAIPAERFRFDVCSTEIRARRGE